MREDAPSSKGKSCPKERTCLTPVFPTTPLPLSVTDYSKQLCFDGVFNLLQPRIVHVRRRDTRPPKKGL